jgi:hypothetical protein
MYANHCPITCAAGNFMLAKPVIEALLVQKATAMGVNMNTLIIAGRDGILFVVLCSKN